MSRGQRYESSVKVGNGDRQITAADPIFNQLVLWEDKDFDAKVTNPSLELVRLADRQVKSINLNYANIMRTDEHGNSTRQQSTFFVAASVGGGWLSKTIFDVWFRALQ